MKKPTFIFLYFFFLILSCGQKNKMPEIDLNHAPNKVELFGENIISTKLYERDMAISPDGSEIIFTVGNYKQTTRCLVKMEKKENEWSEKQIVSFSGKYQDIEPFFSPDGNKLFFASNRPMDDDQERMDYNIWFSEKINNEWAAPTPLNENINTEYDEFFPAVGNSGNLYFTATREDGVGREDIFLPNS